MAHAPTIEATLAPSGDKRRKILTVSLPAGDPKEAETLARQALETAWSAASYGAGRPAAPMPEGWRDAAVTSQTVEQEPDDGVGWEAIREPGWHIHGTFLESVRSLGRSHVSAFPHRWELNDALKAVVATDPGTVGAAIGCRAMEVTIDTTADRVSLKPCRLPGASGCPEPLYITATGAEALLAIGMADWARSDERTYGQTAHYALKPPASATERAALAASLQSRLPMMVAPAADTLRDIGLTDLAHRLEARTRTVGALA